MVVSGKGTLRNSFRIFLDRKPSTRKISSTNNKIPGEGIEPSYCLTYLDCKAGVATRRKKTRCWEDRMKVDNQQRSGFRDYIKSSTIHLRKLDVWTYWERWQDPEGDLIRNVQSDEAMQAVITLFTFILRCNLSSALGMVSTQLLQIRVYVHHGY